MKQRVFIIAGALTLGVLECLHDLPALNGIDAWVNRLCAATAAWMLRLVGHDCTHIGTTLVSSLSVLRVEHECNPISSLALLLPLIAAWSRRPLRSAAILTSLIIALNQVRIALLLLLTDLFPGHHALLDGFVVRIPYWLGVIGCLALLLQQKDEQTNRPASFPSPRSRHRGARQPLSPEHSS